MPAQVYVHSRPDFLGYPRGHLFHGARTCAQAACRCRRPARSVAQLANWRCCAGYELVHRTGSGWLVATAAMYTLLKAAVDNPVNQFFVLLSEACLPLYPPAALYLQIIHEPRSRTNGAHVDRPHEAPVSCGTRVRRAARQGCVGGSRVTRCARPQAAASWEGGPRLSCSERGR